MQGQISIRAIKVPAGGSQMKTGPLALFPFGWTAILPPDCNVKPWADRRWHDRDWYIIQVIGGWQHRCLVTCMSEAKTGWPSNRPMICPNKTFRKKIWSPQLPTSEWNQNYQHQAHDAVNQALIILPELFLQVNLIAICVLAEQLRVFLCSI